MKFLADMNVSLSTAQCLRTEGYDTIHLREERLERLSDSAIIEKAAREGRVILTFDLDFGDLMAASGAALPSVIIFRLSDERPVSVSLKLLDVLKLKQVELERGAIIVVGDARCRARLLPVRPVEDD
jgi:predicted nuclease of predicted toxin-antitoxin system